MNKSLLLLISFFILSQLMANEPNKFEAVDSYARKTVKASTYEKTAEKLVAPFDNDTDKARAIFIWLTERVSYDIHKFKRQQRNPQRKQIFANTLEELEKIKRDRQDKLAKEAFRSGKGVCEDYSYLFQFMCEHVGIEASFIPGYGRFSPFAINVVPRGWNHAWNGVKIDGKWYLLDATWAAGNTDTQAGKFTKDYKEGFFMAPPEKFILSHFPENPEWQLLDQTYDKTAFSTLPYAFPAFSDQNIQDYFPKKGVISSKLKTGKVSLEVSDTKLKYVLVDNRMASRQKPLITGSSISFTFNPGEAKNHEITIAIQEDKKLKPLISYLVI